MGKIMANIKFYGTEKSETEAKMLTAHVNSNNELFLMIEDGLDGYHEHICLDKETALLLLNQLTKEINEIK